MREKVCVLALIALLTPAAASVGPDPPDENPAPLLIRPEVILGTQIAPEYPPSARQARIEGWVVVEVTIDKSGKTGAAKVLQRSHAKLGFEEAALDAVRLWRFQPATVDGEPVHYTTQFKLSFRYPSRAKTGFVSSTLVPAKESVDREGRSQRPSERSTRTRDR